MNVLIVHHHLKPGGVTRIIESQLKALGLQDDVNDISLAVGLKPDEFDAAGNKVYLCEELNYLVPPFDPDEALVKLQAFFDQFPDETVFHCHNLNLGKNPVATYAVYLEATKGRRVLNHCHDFAEDRPVNYDLLKEVIEVHFGEKLHKILYPEQENYRFATINQADYKRLISFGIKPEQLDLLENPVAIPHFEPIPAQDVKRVRSDFGANKKKLAVYPVRGIRRKNIGEFILLSALFTDSVEWVTTLPPKNPVERVEYDLWTEFCYRKSIRVHFGAGEKYTFPEIMQSADFCVTTSIREGFGMAFLEPWLFGKPVVGRYLPQVCGDFAAYGIEFPVLYEQLNTPNGSDFADLEVDDKMEYILKIKKDETTRNEFLSANPQLNKITAEVPELMIENNIRRIKDNYSLESYGEKLNEIYKKFS